MDLSGLPDPKKEYTQRFENLSGGLNLRDLDYLLKPNESPEMKNLNWHDGVLACRDGQTLLSKSRGQVYACAEEPFHDRLVVHCGASLYAVTPSTGSWMLLLQNVAQERGTFFRYNEFLMYKNRGGYYKIAYRESGDGLFATSIYSDKSRSEAFIPVIQLNTDPKTGAGDLYQLQEGAL